MPSARSVSTIAARRGGGAIHPKACAMLITTRPRPSRARRSTVPDKRQRQLPLAPFQGLSNVGPSSSMRLRRSLPVVQVIGMMVGVHIVEAYLLNPQQIYSFMLKPSPIYVLLVLYIAEHAVGVQGLLIAVPLAVYMAKTLVGNEELSKDQVTPQLE